MANQLLYSVKEVFTSYCGTMKYFIPSYQRGYKWEEKDIKRLLDDINEFKVIDDFDAFYCLQNISIIENKGVLNVVDGQQRLTTLSILLSYLGEADMVKGKLEYSKRQTTQKFLNEYVYTACLKQHMSEDWNWDTFIEKTDNQEYDYQDIFYIFMAWKTIDGWFIDHREELEPMKNKILENVKLIVNRPANIDEHKLFENLNGKRVPLDGADLVRAMIITRSAKLKIAEGEDSIKYDVLLNEYRTGIGNRLDAVNQWWENENRQKYFSYFMAGAEAVSDGMIEFNQDKYPINNLYLLYGAIYNGGKLSLDFFEKEVTDVAFFDRLINVQRLLRLNINKVLADFLEEKRKAFFSNLKDDELDIAKWDHRQLSILADIVADKPLWDNICGDYNIVFYPRETKTCYGNVDLMSGTRYCRNRYINLKPDWQKEIENNYGVRLFLFQSGSR